MTQDRLWRGSTILLGFALGGFFDGILLHQILQWHHLLSLVPGMGDLRLQVLWDGVFHALMYVLAALALAGLWRARFQPAGRKATQGGILIGFGLWHVVDAVLSHWLLGIHRIKPDSAAPLAWDLGWLAIFGLVPVVLGALMLGRRGPPPGRGWVMGLVALAVGLGAWGLRPAPGQPLTAVVFPADLDPAAQVRALADSRASVVWEDPARAVALVDIAPDRRWALYRAGAVYVSGAGSPEGCFAWTADS
jgi:uncharacterized membrane protein